MTEKTIHEGRNVKRIREILGIKQDALAMELGLSQQAVSALEQKEALDKDMIEKIAKVMKVTPESIKTFSEESVVNIISNTFTSHDTSTMNAVNYYPTFNALEKMIELYDALLKSEREKIVLLERLLEKR
ncbi:helix-turn-helix domain-containing protein [Lacibacter sp. H407]|uniref:helix-turn-helix domain-containing protein n=1 Tax=Lacibacter sp. H407 TaxID=3133423 RepID=UPI0030C17B36